MINSKFATDETTGLIINSAVDYSVTPENFILSPPSGEIWNVTRMIFSLSDTGTLDSGFWGATNAALTNGINPEIWKNGTKIFELFEDFPIKQNGQWGAVCFDTDPASWGSGAAWLSVRYTLTKDTNDKIGILLDGTNSDKIVIPLNDDFSDLISQTFRFGINKLY